MYDLEVNLDVVKIHKFANSDVTVNYFLCFLWKKLLEQYAE